jgi:hypothetical protein
LAVGDGRAKAGGGWLEHRGYLLDAARVNRCRRQCSADRQQRNQRPMENKPRLSALKNGLHNLASGF